MRKIFSFLFVILIFCSCNKSENRCVVSYYVDLNVIEHFSGEIELKKGIKGVKVDIFNEIYSDNAKNIRIITVKDDNCIDTTYTVNFFNELTGEESFELKIKQKSLN